jgi:hypothetical protein
MNEQLPLTPSADESAYCTSCGQPQGSGNTSYKDLKASLTFLAILLIFEVFTALFYIFLNSVVAKLLESGDVYSSSQTMFMIYRIFGWLFALAAIALGIVGIIRCKTPLSRGVAVAFLSVHVLAFLIYQIVELFKNIELMSF